MRTPGFTAEATIGSAHESYRARGNAGGTAGAVIAQARPLHFFDCLEIFGGRCFFDGDCDSFYACAYASLISDRW